MVGMKRRSLVFITPAWWLGGSLGIAQAASPHGVVRFGQSASFMGRQAQQGQEVRDGICAAFASASKTGGVRFELLSRDDGGDPERCRRNTRALLAQGVSGFVGFTSSAATEASRGLIEDARIALLGTTSGTMGLRGERWPLQYHVRAGFDAEFRRMVSYVKDYGLRRVACVSMLDTSAADVAAMTAALNDVGVTLTVSVALEHGARSVEAEARKLVAAKLDCILFTTPAAPMVGMVEQLLALRYRGLYVSSSLAGEDLIDAMARLDQGVITTQVVPRPNARLLPVAERCRRDLAALGRGTRKGFTALEGYLAGLVAVEAAQAGLRRDGSLPRARFRDALAGLRTDLGGYKVDFAAGRTQGSHFVDVVALDRLGRIIG